MSAAGPDDAAPRCASCDGPFAPTRATQRYCGPRCRVAAWRSRCGLRHGWGDATDRLASRRGAAAVPRVTGQS